MDVENIPIAEIIPYSKNPRKNDKAVDIVAKSIKEFGFKVPIILDKNNVIIAGHTRLKAAEKLGLKEVPVLWADDLTPEQVKAFRIMDNKSSEYAEWDRELLKGELKELLESNFNLELTGLRESEINEIIGEQIENNPLKEPKYIINKGEIWQFGNHFLICGDARDKECYKKLIGNNKIKLVFTSPPYNMGSNLYANTGGMDYKDDLPSKEYIDLNLETIKNIIPYLKGYIFWNLSYNINSRWEFIEIYYRIIKETGLKFLENIIWDKGIGLPIISPKILRRTYEQILVVGDEETI